VKIKMTDLKIKMVTGDDGNAEYTTSVVQGVLHSFLVDTSGALAKLDCYLQEYPGVTLLSLNNVMGNNYLPVAHAAVDGKGGSFNYSADKYVLNNKLVFRVMGKRGTQVEIVVRYS